MHRSSLHRWLVVIAFAVVACRRDPSPEEYCRMRDDAWGRAFPEDSKTFPHDVFVESCIKTVREEQAKDPELWKRRVQCLRQCIRDDQSGAAANDAYLALARCEGGEAKSAPASSAK
jgi:hypothetical protein